MDQLGAGWYAEHAKRCMLPQRGAACGHAATCSYENCGTSACGRAANTVGQGHRLGHEIIGMDTARNRLHGELQVARKVSLLGLRYDGATSVELGISETLRARPIQAAFASAGGFAVGAAMPLIVTAVVPVTSLIVFVSGASRRPCQ